MTTYVPFLKAKPGEFEAYGALTSTTLAGVTPIFELCPDTDLDKALRAAATKAKRYLPVGSRIAVDASAVRQLTPRPPLGNLTPIEWVCGELGSHGLSVMPVAPLDDPAAQAHVVAAAPSTGRAVIRADARSTTTALLRTQLASAPSNTGLASTSLHVVLDFRAERDAKQVAAVTAHAANLITEANRIGPWASITVAAGAFPDTISALPTGVSTPVDRLDAQVWRALTKQGYVVNFGDYGVNGPAMASGGRAPLPNLRYLDGRQWQVWRESKTRPGNESFYDLCKRVVADRCWSGSGYSWGDAQIELAAREQRGPGTATQWRAFGTSHHITGVVDRLATLGEP